MSLVRMRQRSIYADVACVCKHPLGHLNVCQLSGIPPGGASTQSDSIMQHERRRTPPVFFLCEGGPVLTPADGTAPPRNFAEMLPTEMSVRIFGELDAASLCSAARTCRLWHQIIEQSEQLWRRQCLLVRAICQREVDSDRRHGLSWKVTLVRNFIRSCVKRDWLIGRFSHVRSADELRDRKLMPLDAETWGEILQAELDR